jgi:hypothetical protein
MSDYIELPTNNLYANGTLVATDGTVSLERRTLRITPQEGDAWHIVQDADMLDALAERYYGGIALDASKYWWILADANGIANPLDIDHIVGSMLLVPDLFRVQRLATIDQTDDEDDTELSNIFTLYANPPTALNPPEVITPDGTGRTDAGNNTAIPHLFLLQPNGGYTLVTAKDDGDPQYTEANPNDYPNPLIFNKK